MSTMTEELILLADILDAGGFYKEAEEVDEASEKLSANSGAIRPFVKALKDALTKQMEGNDALNNVLSTIDNVVNQGGWTEYKMSQEEYATWQGGQDPSVSRAKHLWALEDDVKKLEYAKRQERDSEKWDFFDEQIDDDGRQMEVIHALVREWQEGKRDGDKEKYEKFMKTYSDPARTEVGYDYADSLSEENKEVPPGE